MYAPNRDARTDSWRAFLLALGIVTYIAAGSMIIGGILTGYYHRNDPPGTVDPAWLYVTVAGILTINLGYVYCHRQVVESRTEDGLGRLCHTVSQGLILLGFISWFRFSDATPFAVLAIFGAGAIVGIIGVSLCRIIPIITAAAKL